ncbi:MAG TPA: Rho termination factor N-terminal domain-containing protein [Solirubrobacteraceae bacterium]|jgi:transcription termination factor Rho
MTVFEPSELQASPLSDLHAIADQLGLDGYRKLRKEELIEAIISRSKPSDETSEDSEHGDGAQRRRRYIRPGRFKSPDREAEEPSKDEPASKERPASKEQPASKAQPSRKEQPSRKPAREPAKQAAKEPAKQPAAEDRVAEGVVELLGNGSAFLRVTPPEASDEDVYISAAQVRRCELVSGDKVTGPVRTPRRSERYPSLVRVDTINGSSADTVADGPRFEDMPASYPSERLQMNSEDPTLKAIEWLTPIGRGSRAVIVGASRAGKTETLRRILGALSSTEKLEVLVVALGLRPEELSEFREGPVAPVAALSFATSADSQGQALDRAMETAKRIAVRGGDALVLIDTLDGLHPTTARKALACARNLTASGTLTVIATASSSFGGETTVIALDVALTSTGRLPAIDLLSSGTLKAELLVGEDGANAIAQARANALVQ